MFGRYPLLTFAVLAFARNFHVDAIRASASSSASRSQALKSQVSEARATSQTQISECSGHFLARSNHSSQWGSFLNLDLSQVLNGDLSQLMPSAQPGKTKPKKVEIDSAEDTVGSLLRTQLAVLGASLVAAFLCLSLVVRTSGASENVTVCSLSIFYLFYGDMIFATLFPYAYDVAKAVGGDAVYSGALIAAYQPGCCIGSFISWALLQHNPEIWRTKAKSLMFVGVLLEVLGTLMFCCVLYASVIGIHGFGEQLVLIGSRFTVGLGVGMLAQFSLYLVGAVLPAADRPAQMVLVFLAFSLGIGFGPLFAAGAEGVSRAVPNGARVPGFVSVSTATVAFPLTALMSLLFLYPSLRDVKSFIPRPGDVDVSKPIVDSQNASALSVVSKRKCVVGTSLIFSMNRSYILSALEAATSLILEKTYGKSPMTIGFLVSACFCGTPILKFILDATSETFSIAARVRGLMALVILGASLMLVSGHAWLLLTADALLFPAFFIAEGLMQGIMAQHTFPPGYLLNLNNVALANVVLVAGVSRAAGPPIARLHVMHGGQTEYAVQQLVMCLLGWMLLEWIICKLVPVEVLNEADEPCKDKKDDEEEQFNEADQPNPQTPKDEGGEQANDA